MISKAMVTELLGNLTVEQLNELAEKLGLKTAKKKDAQIGIIAEGVKEQKAMIRVPFALFATRTDEEGKTRTGSLIFAGRLAGHKDYKQIYPLAVSGGEGLQIC